MDKHLRPSDKFERDKESGTITPAIDFWLYRQAAELMKYPKPARLPRIEKHHPNFQQKIKDYLIRINNSRRHTLPKLNY